MSDHTTWRSIGDSISKRASLMAELAEKLAEESRLDAELREDLLRKAPENVRYWLTESAVLTRLFQYGFCNTKVRFDGDYGFKSSADAITKMNALRNAWMHDVRVRTARDGPARLEVRLFAIM